VVGIAATAYISIQDIDYDQYRPATSEKNSCTHHTFGAYPVILAPFMVGGK
jgi:hypothetical protein